MREELKPCPFCGSRAEYSRYDDTESFHCTDYARCWALTFTKEKWEHRYDGPLDLDDEGLKPCPFCGGKGAIVERGGAWFAVCTEEKCRAYIGYPHFADAEEARAAWNARTADRTSHTYPTPMLMQKTMKRKTHAGSVRMVSAEEDWSSWLRN